MYLFNVHCSIAQFSCFISRRFEIAIASINLGLHVHSESKEVGRDLGFYYVLYGVGLVRSGFKPLPLSASMWFNARDKISNMMHFKSIDFDAF